MKQFVTSRTCTDEFYGVFRNLTIKGMCISSHQICCALHPVTGVAWPNTAKLGSTEIQPPSEAVCWSAVRHKQQSRRAEAAHLQVWTCYSCSPVETSTLQIASAVVSGALMALAHELSCLKEAKNSLLRWCWPQVGALTM